MKILISIILLCVIALGTGLVLEMIPFGEPKTKIGEYYIDNGVEKTGAVNIVTAVVLDYRGFDTLGEITVLFIAAVGLGSVLFSSKKSDKDKKQEPASLILSTGCRFLFPLILLLGAYIFVHGHLSPGGGFQGGAIIASAFVLVYLGCPGIRVNKTGTKIVESLGGLIFITMGLLGLLFGGYFLLNFLPKGIAHTLLSAGIIPIIYVAIGFKVGSELAGIIDNLIGRP